MNLKSYLSLIIYILSTKLCMRAITPALITALLVIVSISTHHASAEVNNCHKPPKNLSNFSPQTPPRAALNYPFFDAQDSEHTIADYKGLGVVLNFWATWCSPCIREMPDLIHLKKLLKKDSITVLAVSVDRGGATKILRFFKNQGLKDLDILVDKKSKLARKSGVRGLPVTILIDAKGLERGRVTGIAPWGEPEVINFVRRCIAPLKS
jgi:thiol-disulfide isomerase/thioredoxin